MHILLDQLVNELSKRHGVRAYNTDERVIKGVEMFPVDSDGPFPLMRQDIAYICNYSQLRKCPTHVPLAPIICAVESNVNIDKCDSVFFADRIVVMAIESSVSEVLLTLTKLFYEFGSRTPTVTDVSYAFIKCRSLQELIDEGSRVLGNPIIVTDSGQKIIAGSDSAKVSHSAYADILSLGHLPAGRLQVRGGLPYGRMTMDWPHDTVMKFEMPIGRAEDIGSDYSHMGKLRPQCGENNLSFLCKQLIIIGEVVGYLHVFQLTREFDKNDPNITELLGNFIAVELMRHPQKKDNGSEEKKDRLLRNILDDAPWSKDETEARRKQVGLCMKPYLYTVLMQVARIEDVHRISLHDLTKKMASMLPHARGILHRNAMLLLLGSDCEIDDFEEVLAPIIPLIEKYGLIAGISNKFTSINDIRRNAFSSIKAIQLGYGLHKGRTLYRYRDYAIYYLMELTLRSEGYDMFCLPEISRLTDYCEKHGDELMVTLRAYLRCGRNKVKTAKELYVHLSTIKYRMMQVQNIMGISLDTDENALKLLLTIKMIEYQEAFPNTALVLSGKPEPLSIRADILQ
jgi:sugar diacid utilization regulator